MFLGNRSALQGGFCFLEGFIVTEVAISQREVWTSQKEVSISYREVVTLHREVAISYREV